MTAEIVLVSGGDGNAFIYLLIFFFFSSYLSVFLLTTSMLVGAFVHLKASFPLLGPFLLVAAVMLLLLPICIIPGF